MANAPFKVKLATPCSMSWDDMDGDEQVRFCKLCKKNVYDLSTLTRDEAVGLVRSRENNLCVSFYERRDGTVLTSDCPVGMARARYLAAMSIALVVAVFLAPVLFARRTLAPNEPLTFNNVLQSMRTLPVVGPLLGAISPPPPPVLVNPNQSKSDAMRRRSGGIRSFHTNDY